MLHKKLLEILQKLNAPQLKRLRQFVAHPYFGAEASPETMTALLDFLQSRNLDEHHPDLQKETASAHFFPAKKYQEKSKNPIDHLASELFKKTCLFLTTENWLQTEQPEQQFLALAKFYRQHDLADRYEQNLEAWKKHQSQKLERGSDYFLSEFRMQKELAQAQNQFNSFEGDANLLSTIEQLDAFHALEKWDLACTLKFHSLQSKTPLPTIQLPEFQGIAAGLGSSQIFKKLYELLENPTEPSHFETLEKLIAQHRATLPPLTLAALKSYVRFFLGIQYVKNGDPALLQKLFDVNLEHLREGYFYKENKISPNQLKNLVNLSLKLKKFDAAHQFLMEHPPSRITGTRFPDEVWNLNLGELLFHTQNWDEALEKVAYRKFEFPIYGVLADVLMVKIFYEKGEFQLLDSRLDALEQKIHRLKISPQIKKPYLHFHHQLEQILRMPAADRAEKGEVLREKIRGTAHILEREWLLKILG